MTKDALLLMGARTFGDPPTEGFCAFCQSAARRYPPDSSPPDNLAHFCFSPLLKLNGPSELSFCLTDSSGKEKYGLSLQFLFRQESSSSTTGSHGVGPRAGTKDVAAAQNVPSESRVRLRPIALVILSSRPLLNGFSVMLRSLVPLVHRTPRLPTEKESRVVEVRIGRDPIMGLGLILNPNNTVLQIELDSIAAREQRLRPGDVITSFNGKELNGMRLSDALSAAIRASVDEQTAASIGSTNDGSTSTSRSDGACTDSFTGARGLVGESFTCGGSSCSRGSGAFARIRLGVRRTCERLVTSDPESCVLIKAVEAVFERMSARGADLLWLSSNPFWSAAPLEPLFQALRWSTAEVVYLLLSVLTDQKVSLKRP
eukprot:scaffold127571_cov35-Tisochrysis_lutea.AAC.3